jgi:hypothetical protein
MGGRQDWAVHAVAAAIRTVTEDYPTPQPLFRTRYGTAHPERVDNPLWEQAMREDWSGYALGQHLASADARSGHDYSQSAYRDTDPGPFWSWQRFGRTSTPLPDGRIIHIAGEHEDAYDPDFCIYNDVVVEHPDGRREFLLYPKDVFPPTDFHSATLVGEAIVLIGSLGYRDLRRPGETQVLKLDTRSLRFETVATTGEGPGWISRHSAERLGETAMRSVGGSVQTAAGYERSTGMFELDLVSMTWRRRPHGDTALFPIADAVYRRAKCPRYGAANPERNDNPFWLEMARRRWPPSRARLHFGSFPPPQPELVLPDDDTGRDAPYGSPEANAWMARLSDAAQRSKLKRSIDDVVWTAVREDALELELADGRTLLIGGEVADYGDEYADPWVYNDIVVTQPNGAIELLTYPLEVFPHLLCLVGVANGENIYLFGLVDRKRHPGQPRGPLVLRLDTATYAITPIAVDPPAARVSLYKGSAVREGSRVMFPLVRDRGSDPHMQVAFDLESHAWSAPFPQP